MSYCWQIFRVHLQKSTCTTSIDETSKFSFWLFSQYKEDIQLRLVLNYTGSGWQGNKKFQSFVKIKLDKKQSVTLGWVCVVHYHQICSLGRTGRNLSFSWPVTLVEDWSKKVLHVSMWTGPVALPKLNGRAWLKHSFAMAKAWQTLKEGWNCCRKHFWSPCFARRYSFTLSLGFLFWKTLTWKLQGNICSWFSGLRRLINFNKSSREKETSKA